jgi:hypothetical protein
MLNMSGFDYMKGIHIQMDYCQGSATSQTKTLGGKYLMIVFCFIEFCCINNFGLKLVRADSNGNEPQSSSL